MALAGITYRGRDVGQRCGKAAVPGTVGLMPEGSREGAGGVLEQ